MKHSKRDFLKFVSAAGTSATLGSLGLGSFMHSAYADSHCEAGSWGQIVGDVDGWTCDNHEGYKVLEIFLYLGAAQWPSMWLPGSGAPLFTPNFTDHGLDVLPIGDLDWTQNTADFPCDTPAIPVDFDEFAHFGQSSTGSDIYWGAATRPLYSRSEDMGIPDIFERCRMITSAHELSVHQLAQRLTLTGLTLGNARSAGTGAAVQRRARAVSPDQLLPAAYVLHQNQTQAKLAATSIGAHPGFSRPVDIAISDNNGFVDSLSRTGISSESDNLLLSLRHELHDRLRFQGAGAPVRSQGFAGYWAAAELLENAPLMEALFADDILIRDDNVAVCPADNLALGLTPQTGIKTMIDAAASLLSSGSARYVCAIDSGLSGTYDTHNTSGTTPAIYNTNANIYNVMHHLAANIHHPTNNPAGLIDLDDTMVVLTTDFNRTPFVPRTDGLDHWPEGCVNLMVGGPINSRDIAGSIDASGFTEAAYQYSPTDIRAALLLAAGIDPFADGNFRVSDFSAALTAGYSTETEIRTQLKSVILGA